MTNEWLKIKTVRDFNRIYQNGVVNTAEKNKIFSSSTKYANFLALILNVWNNHYMKTYNDFPNRKIKTSDLDNINIDLINDIAKLNNVEIVNAPFFVYMYIENNQVFSKSCNVSDCHIPDPLYFIKSRPGFVFHIYTIGDKYMREDKDRMKRERKEKLKKLELEL